MPKFQAEDDKSKSKSKSKSDYNDYGQKCVQLWLNQIYLCCGFCGHAKKKSSQEILPFSH